VADVEKQPLKNDTSNLIEHCVCGKFFRTRGKWHVEMMDRGFALTVTIQSSQDVNRAGSYSIKNFNTQQTINSFHHNYRAEDIQQMLISSLLLCLLTLSVRAQYIYSAASQATSPAPFKYLFNKYPY
jgi:hypothetical protein